MSRKRRISTRVVVMVLLALAFSAVAIALVVTAAGTDGQQEAVPTATQAAPALSLPQPTPEPQDTPEPTYASMIRSFDWDGEDSRMLVKTAMAEAEGETVEGKALVMLVVLNRVWSDQFPDSIEEVIFQKNQFSVVAEGGRYWTTEPDAGCYEALELVMSGWDESQGALYFDSAGKDGWHSRNLEFLFEFGGHSFYR